MSKLLNRVVEELAKLPSIGDRSALRLALHILSQQPSDIERLTDAISNFRKDVKYCKYCNNLSDTDICPICGDISRDRELICVVENVKDVLSIESTGQYKGLYFVLGGVISPMRGISPSSLKVEVLVENIKRNDTKEVILALNTSMEGETTIFYISRKLLPLGIKVSNLARGIGFEDNLEQADELTLMHAINFRTQIK